MDFPGKEAVVFCSVEVIELCDEVFLSISYQRWGKVRLGSVHDKMFPSMCYPKWGRVRLSISYPRWGKVRLGSVLGEESCPEGQLLYQY